MRAAAKNLETMLLQRIKKVLILSNRNRALATFKAEQIYVESVFRFYVTPYVIANTIKVDAAIELWAKTHRLFTKAPKAVRSTFLLAATP
jgi:hypothetical protein